MFSYLATAAIFAQATLAFPHPPSGPPPPPPPGPKHPPGPPGPPGPHPPSGPQPWGYFTNNTIYATSGSEGITYPRYIELTDGTILATSALSGNNPNYFPVFESCDGGAHWTYISNLTDQVNGWGMSAQPALEVLHTAIGGYPAGTILGSGNSWSQNGTKIDLYASTDVGRTWKFVSHIANGTAPNTTNGAHPIWEPKLL